MKNVEDAKSSYQLSADIKKAEMNLKRLQEECAVLIAKVEEQEKEVKTWSPVGGRWRIASNGSVDNWAIGDGSKEFGAQRPTEQQAKRASVEMRRFNRLLALKDELCGDELCDEGVTKYFIFFNTENKQWDFTHYFISDYVTPCFTKHEHAQRACDMLNSGQVEL